MALKPPPLRLQDFTWLTIQSLPQEAGNALHKSGGAVLSLALL